MATGGVAAAFGFLYQHLVTVEMLLDLYASASADWLLAVDLHGQDSADVLIYDRRGAPPRRAVQVKASLPETEALMSKPEAEALLASIAGEHPVTAERAVRTNRALTAPAEKLARNLKRNAPASGAARDEIDARVEGVREVTDRLIERLARVRP